MWKQRIALRQIAHSTMLRWQAAERLALGGQQARDGEQQCGLALAALPQQDGKALDLKTGLQTYRMVDPVIDAHGIRTGPGGAKPSRASRAGASPPGRIPTAADIPQTARYPAD